MAAMETALELPVLSQARLRALALVSDASANPVEIASVAGSDPALTALTLRAANSAFSAPRERVTRVHDAIVRIGLRETRQILAAAMLTRAFAQLVRSGLDEREVWRHSILCGMLAEGVSKLEPHTQMVRDAAFSAGLLHDIGRLHRASSDPSNYRRALALMRAGTEVRAAEREVFGSDHLEWGDAVGRACRLPQEVRSAIAGHHDEPNVAVARREPLRDLLARIHPIALSLEAASGHDDAGAHARALTAEEQRLVTALGGADELRDRIESFRRAVV